MENFNPKAVTIGNQVWMAENLDIDDGKGGIFYNEENGEYYYTYDAAMRIANSIPGWHVPTALEWNEVALACGAFVKKYDGAPAEYNDYGNVQELKDKLVIKLSGSYNGSFYNVGTYALFWTSTEFSSTNAYYRGFNTGTSVISSYNDKYFGLSVRLVKDA